MVYFIRATQSGLIKIGRTIRDVNKRLRELQTGSAEKLELLTVVESGNERQYHNRFKENKSHGEWFYPSPDLLSFLKTIEDPSILYLCDLCGIGVRKDEFEGWDNETYCLPCAAYLTGVQKS